jgi:hypothetical protein
VAGKEAFNMQLIGYSERGVLNALLYEIAYSSAPSELLSDLVSHMVFPFTESRPPPAEADVLIEQSFSDFGDADALILFTEDVAPSCSIFVEAKVKSYQATDWSIGKEFKRFQSGLQGTASSSNLFTQMYHKYRLVQSLQQGGSETLKQGVVFPDWSSKQRRKIGANKVVLEAVRRLQNRIGQVFYVALVPEQPERVEAFCRSALDRGKVAGVPDWDISTWGYLTWSQVEGFCEAKRLKRTLEVFCFNRGQIYS